MLNVSVNIRQIANGFIVQSNAHDNDSDLNEYSEIFAADADSVANLVSAALHIVPGQLTHVTLSDTLVASDGGGGV
jgi:hypothetical protein